MANKRESLSDQLRRLVRASGESLGELHKATGVQPSAISRLLSGERFVSEEGFNALGEHLGLRLVGEKHKRKGG